MVCRYSRLAIYLELAGIVGLDCWSALVVHNRTRDAYRVSLVFTCKIRWEILVVVFPNNHLECYWGFQVTSEMKGELAYYARIIKDDGVGPAFRAMFVVVVYDAALTVPTSPMCSPALADGM